MRRPEPAPAVGSASRELSDGAVAREHAVDGDPVGADLVTEDEAFLAEIDRVMEGAADRCGSAWGCGPGRADCCKGPFPIRQLDAWRLRKGLVRLARRNEESAHRILGRTRAWLVAAREHAADELDDLAAGELDDDQETLAWLCDELAELDCPVLDPVTRRCDLYAWRPRVCRTFGPPTRLAGRDQDPCPFCFATLDPSQLEELRFDPDPDLRERELEELLESETGASGLSFVALALAVDSEEPSERG